MRQTYCWRRMTENRMHVKIETQKETQKGDVTETLEIKISDELGTRNYEMYSGGEAFRINFAIRIALSRLLARRAGAPLPTSDHRRGFRDTGRLRNREIERSHQFHPGRFRKNPGDYPCRGTAGCFPRADRCGKNGGRLNHQPELILSLRNNSLLASLSENSPGNGIYDKMNKSKNKSPLIPPVRTSGTCGLSRKGENEHNLSNRKIANSFIIVLR